MATTRDLGEFKEVADLLELMSLDELRSFCETALKAATTGQLIFKARFPAAYEEWNDRIERGEIGFRK